MTIASELFTETGIKGVLKTTLIAGAGAAVSYYGLDRKIPYMPSFVLYGIAGGASGYIALREPGMPITNTFIALFTSPIGIVGGYTASYLL